MTTEAYVRDPRFEVLGCGVKYEWLRAADSRGDLTWIDGGNCKNVLPKIPWEDTACICHHAQFDGLILSHHYGIKPAFWLDTLSMARLVIGNHLSVSLDNLAKHYGLHGKTIDYKSFKGKHWHELNEDERKRLSEGCLRDIEITWELFCMMMRGDDPIALR